MGTSVTQTPASMAEIAQTKWAGSIVHAPPPTTDQSVSWKLQRR